MHLDFGLFDIHEKSNVRFMFHMIMEWNMSHYLVLSFQYESEKRLIKETGRQNIILCSMR